MSFAGSVNVAIRNGADTRTRDAVEAYTRQDFKGEYSGVFQLVLLWKAVGHTVRTIGGPSRETERPAAFTGWTRARCHQERQEPTPRNGLAPPAPSGRRSDRRHV